MLEWSQVISRAPTCCSLVRFTFVEYHNTLLEGFEREREGSVCTEGRDKACYSSEFLEIKGQNIPSWKKEALRLKQFVFVFSESKNLNIEGE